MMREPHIVRALIDEAFISTQRDEECTLHQAQLADESMIRDISDEEWQLARDRDPETDWRNVPAGHLDECNAALSHSSPQGWLFYLPAYMRRALELLNSNSSSDLPGSVIFHLTYTPSTVGLDWFRLERFRLVSDTQERAIVEFLRYVAEHPRADRSDMKDASLALKNYWMVTPGDRPRGIEIAP